MYPCTRAFYESHELVTSFPVCMNLWTRRGAWFRWSQCPKLLWLRAGYCKFRWIVSYSFLLDGWVFITIYKETPWPNGFWSNSLLPGVFVRSRYLHTHPHEQTPFDLGWRLRLLRVTWIEVEGFSTKMKRQFLRKKFGFGLNLLAPLSDQTIARRKGSLVGLCSATQ